MRKKARTQPCKRCGKSFKPLWLDALQKWGSMCQECMARNLFDALDLPTPPSLLDRHTKIPALTDREFLRILNNATTD